MFSGSRGTIDWTYASLASFLIPGVVPSMQAFSGVLQKDGVLFFSPWWVPLFYHDKDVRPSPRMAFLFWTTILSIVSGSSLCYSLDLDAQDAGPDAESDMDFT